ncbi:MAG: hypothetical protein H0W88_04370 [Parachlamydiaceae bacterium]|nr:hypothetical protein [Parachlamydiaceae bacterium]
MKTIHIANTDFEFELANDDISIPIDQAWNNKTMCLQLQYLPLIYADESDAIALTTLPDQLFIEYFSSLPWRSKAKLPAFIPIGTKQKFDEYDRCVSWGASRKIQQWANERGVYYTMPEWEIVKKINSKAYSFSNSPPLANSALIWNSNDLKKWLKIGHGKRVLKTCFGLSGKGHFHIDDHTEETKILNFCEKEWIHNRPLIAEPWLERVFDFSTQWYLDIDKGVQFIGATMFESNSKGVYQSTKIGSEDVLFGPYIHFLEKHKNICFEMLENILKIGYFGYLGIDAFIYKKTDSAIALQPIVEINGRQTMSLAALFFQRRWFPDKTVQLFFSKDIKEKNFLLPNKIISHEGKEIVFNLHLSFSIN